MAEGISDYDTTKEKSIFNEEFSRIRDDLTTVQNNLEQWIKQAEGDQNEKDLAETKATLDRTRTDLEVTKTALEETKTALEETKTALEEALIKSEDQKNRILSQEMKLKAAMEEADMFKNSTVKLARQKFELEAEGDQNEKDLAETKTTLDRTRTALEVTKAALEEALIESEDQKNRILSQEMKLRAAMEEADMYKNSTVKLARQKFELEAQCIKNKEALKTSERTLEQHKGELITTQQRLVQMQEDFLESEKERDMFKSDCVKLDRQKFDLESKCTSLETTLEETKMALEEAQSMLQMKEEEIEKEREMLKNSTSKCTHTERVLEKTQTELEDTKRALKSEQHVCRVICEQKDDQSCFCREYVKKVEDLLTGIAGLVDCFCQSKTVMHQCCERGIEEGQKRMDILKHEVNSLANTLEGLSFKRPEAKVFLRAEVKNEQDSLLEHDEKVDSVVRKLYQLKEYISEWEKQRNLPVNATSSNSHNASVPKIERVYGDVAVVTEHMRACSNTSKEVDGQNEDLKGKHFQRLQSYVAEIEERDEEIGKLKNKVVMLEERQAKNIVDSSWTAATCRAPHQKTIRVFLEFYKEEILSKMEVFRLGEKLHSEGILPESLLTSIKDVEDTQEANVMFVQHAIRNYHFTACVTLCDVMRSVHGYPQMNRLGEEMWKELEKNQEEYERTDC